MLFPFFVSSKNGWMEGTRRASQGDVYDKGAQGMKKVDLEGGVKYRLEDFFSFFSFLHNKYPFHFCSCPSMKDGKKRGLRRKLGHDGGDSRMGVFFSSRHECIFSLICSSLVRQSGFCFTARGR
jgi:hypothetical protein